MGYHLYHFYEDDEKLAKALSKFFLEGLRKREYCVWVPRDGISHNRAIDLLKKHIPDIEDYLLKDQMYIEPFDTWGLDENGVFDKGRLMDKWMSKYEKAMSEGYMMMRAAGDPSSIVKKHWDEFMAFESEINEGIDDMDFVAVCTYQGKSYKPTELKTILRNHFCPLTPNP